MCDFDDRALGSDGAGDGYVRTPIDVYTPVRGLERFEEGDRVARSDLCDALVEQDLESLYGRPVEGWAEANINPYPSCEIATTDLFVSNSPTVNEAFLTALSQYARFSGSSIGSPGVLVQGNSGVVYTGTTLVYFTDIRLDDSGVETLGRLIDRVVAQLISDG